MPEVFSFQYLIAPVLFGVDWSRAEQFTTPVYSGLLLLGAEFYPFENKKLTDLLRLLRSLPSCCASRFRGCEACAVVWRDRQKGRKLEMQAGFARILAACFALRCGANSLRRDGEPPSSSCPRCGRKPCSEGMANHSTGGVMPHQARLWKSEGPITSWRSCPSTREVECFD
jgi:hypothetical protein